jgi:hypothetical protein
VPARTLASRGCGASGGTRYVRARAATPLSPPAVDDRDLPCGTSTRTGRTWTPRDATPDAAQAEIARLALLGDAASNGAASGGKPCAAPGPAAAGAEPELARGFAAEHNEGDR